jgi:hypothetical protein
MNAREKNMGEDIQEGLQEVQKALIDVCFFLLQV